MISFYYLTINIIEVTLGLRHPVVKVNLSRCETECITVWATRRDVCFSPLKAGIIVFHVRTSLARSHSNFHASAARTKEGRKGGRKGELREGRGRDEGTVER